jgi:hypothetical protein
MEPELSITNIHNLNFNYTSIFSPAGNNLNSDQLSSTTLKQNSAAIPPINPQHDAKQLGKDV